MIRKECFHATNANDYKYPDDYPCYSQRRDNKLYLYPYENYFLHSYRNLFLDEVYLIFSTPC